MHLVDLPFDILVCILLELTTAATWEIRGLNRALYRASAKRLFKCIDIKLDYPPSKRYLLTFQAITWVATRLERKLSTNPTNKPVI